MTENTDKSSYLTQQWLAEIQSLKQQLSQLQQERDEAWESSQKWRQLYNTEAEQRRTDVQRYEKAIASFKAQLQKLQQIDPQTSTETTADIEQEIAQLTSVEELQVKLITIIKERDRFLHALKIEQQNHEETRNNLTTALGDAIDSLTQARSEGQVTGDR